MLKREEMIKNLKKEYPMGTRVKLVWMDDPQAPSVGTLGTVTHVNDIGTIHVNWDNGSTLGVVYGYDEVKKI